ncbi:MAG: hypothetical protein JNK63_11700 [Chthonomonas sp.]|nr:hypothetical protein [Chthonomonas sp.]
MQIFLDKRDSYLGIYCVLVVVAGLTLLFALGMRRSTRVGEAVGWGRWCLAIIATATAGYATWIAVNVFWGSLP